MEANFGVEIEEKSKKNKTDVATLTTLYWRHLVTALKQAPVFSALPINGVVTEELLDNSFRTIIHGSTPPAVNALNAIFKLVLSSPEDYCKILFQTEVINGRITKMHTNDLYRGYALLILFQ